MKQELLLYYYFIRGNEEGAPLSLKLSRMDTSPTEPIDLEEVKTEEPAVETENNKSDSASIQWRHFQE